jgi:hypothetical protein
MAETSTMPKTKVRDTLAAATAVEKTLRSKYPDKYGVKDGFDGYGSGKDRYVCTTFASKVLKTAGYDISPKVNRQINISGIDWKKETGKPKPSSEDTLAALAQLVSKGDPRTKGVVLALVESGQGVEIDTKALLPGDFVQYWYRSGKHLLGHVVQVVEVVAPGEKFKAHGSHKSTHGVGIITVKVKSKKRVYAVRPKFSPHYNETDALQ